MDLETVAFWATVTLLVIAFLGLIVLTGWLMVGFQ